MKFIIGFIIVIGSVIGGYVLHHGKLEVLWQPTEYLIIMGAAVGSFVIGTPAPVIKETLKSFKFLMKGSLYKKAQYIELLTALYHVFKVMRSKGMLEIEQHIENPHESSLFSNYPTFVHNHHALDFFCDYLRILTMGVENYYTLEDLMDRELEVHRVHGGHIEHLVVNTADAMPALGIVAAVLGVITTMGSISEPPAVLGGLIGAALVGTFLGILISYGFLAPMGRYIGEQYSAEVKYIECIKVALLAHIKGMAPALSVEFARLSLDGGVKPTFAEVEEAVSAVTI
jgi:chemotaxis protein MotA